jgi:predicted alpha/beta hydrolase
MVSLPIRLPALGGTQAATLYPAAQSPAPLLLIAPGMGTRARFYRRLCEGLSRTGISALAFDQPGIGESPVRAARDQDWGYGELVAHYHGAIEHLATEIQPSSIHFLGHSLGGQVALMLPDHPLLRSVVLLASGTPHFRAYPTFRGLQVLAFTRFSATLTHLLGHHPGTTIGFGGRQPRRLIQQWARVAQNGSWNFCPSIDGDAQHQQPGPPVLGIHLPGDTLAPEASLRALTDRLTRRQVQIEAWPDPPLNGDHDRWPAHPEYLIDRLKHHILDSQV